MEEKTKLFNETTTLDYLRIVKSISIAGWTEDKIEDLIKEGKLYPKQTDFKLTKDGTPVQEDKDKLAIECLVHIPCISKKEKDGLKSKYKLVYPDQEYYREGQEFTFVTQTDENLRRINLYSLKFVDYYKDPSNDIKVPLAIVIESEKNDAEQFKLLLFSIYQYFICTDLNILEKLETTQKIFENYKKVELFNIFCYCYSNLYKPSPHTNIQVNLPFLSPKKSIDFYYSSNCEIPCNKADHCITNLFSYLDQTIIFKIIFKLILEKSVILVSSSESVLFTICDALLKLIYPLNWNYTYVTVLPHDYYQFLEIPTMHFYGICRGNMTNQEIVKKANEEFVVDCDTNEIYSDKIYVDFCPLPCSELGPGTKILLRYYNKRLYKYNENSKPKLQPVTFLQHGKVIIDCDRENKLVTEYEDIFLNHEENSNIRKQIQDIKKDNYIFSQNEIGIDNKKNVFNPHKSFDYSINKLFAGMLSEKMEIDNDPLLIDIRHFNIYIDYKDIGKYQNDGPYQVIKNIFKEHMGDERNFNNSFFIKFFINQFPICNIDNDNKYIQFSNEENNNKEQFDNQVKSINELLTDYNVIRNKLKGSDGQLLFDENISDTRSSFSSGYNKNNTFSFYGNDGFINFSNYFFNSLGKNYIKFFDECYNQSIFNEYINYKNEDKEKEKVIEFNQKNYSNCYQYFNYLTVILGLFKKYKVENNDSKINEYNENIIDNYISSLMIDKKDFPFYRLYKFFKSLNENERNEIKVHLYLKGTDEIKEIFEEACKEKETIQ